MYGEVRIGHREAWRTTRGDRRPRAPTSSRGRSSSQARARGVSTHGELGKETGFLGSFLFGVIFLLVRVWHVGHALHICEFRFGCAGAPRTALLGLDCPLVVNVLVPFAQGIIILIANDEIVHHAGVALPENLNAVRAYQYMSASSSSRQKKREEALYHTRFLQTNNISHVCHINAAFELKTWLSPNRGGGLVFAHHQFGLLFVRVDILAAEKDAFEKVDMVLVSRNQGNIPPSKSAIGVSF